MIKEYSIENLQEAIDNNKTKDYFREVIQTYYLGCFRSSVVMLYSVVICDLVYKLQDLRDIYNDSKAKKILIEIDKMQSDNPHSPDWEVKLIDMISERMNFLDSSDMTNIRQLQKHRHLSAHPVLNQTSILFEPNKDTVKAHIRNMLEGILSRPPILTNKIFEELISDLANIENSISDGADLKRYLEARYLKNLRQETINDIFRKLWKFVFESQNEECNEHRGINLKTLVVLIARNEDEILKFIALEKKYFAVNVKDKEMKHLISSFLFMNPKIFPLLRDDVKTLLRSALPNEHYALFNWFFYESFESYLLNIMSMKQAGEALIFNDPNLSDEIYTLYVEHDKESEFLDIAIYVYGYSENYDWADSNFLDCIKPFLHLFSKEHFVEIFRITHTNGQIHDRKKARRDNTIIINEWHKRIGESNEYVQFERFRY